MHSGSAVTHWIFDVGVQEKIKTEIGTAYTARLMANIGLKTYERNLVWECKCTAIPSLSLSFRRSHAPSIFCSLSITPLYLYTHSFSLYMQGEPWNLLLLCMICVLWTSTMAKRQIHTITYKRMCEEESSKIKNFENKKQRTFMTAKSADKFRLSVFFGKSIIQTMIFVCRLFSYRLKCLNESPFELFESLWTSLGGKKLK